MALGDVRTSAVVVAMPPPADSLEVEERCRMPTPAIIGLQVLPIGWPPCGDRATAPFENICSSAHRSKSSTASYTTALLYLAGVLSVESSLLGGDALDQRLQGLLGHGFTGKSSIRSTCACVTATKLVASTVADDDAAAGRRVRQCGLLRCVSAHERLGGRPPYCGKSLQSLITIMTVEPTATTTGQINGNSSSRPTKTARTRRVLFTCAKRQPATPIGHPHLALAAAD